jgi:hypothetical protein
MRRRKKDEARRRRREADGRVVNEVGWRGFKWEEGTAGEGLPRGFRGGKGGLLTEDGIKAVMAKVDTCLAVVQTRTLLILCSSPLRPHSDIATYRPTFGISTILSWTSPRKPSALVITQLPRRRGTPMKAPAWARPLRVPARAHAPAV